MSRFRAERRIFMGRCARCDSDLAVPTTPCPGNPSKVSSDGKVFCTNESCTNSKHPVRMGKAPSPGPKPVK